jgi:hypothetical protein
MAIEPVHLLSAAFDDPVDAKEAMVALEGAGIDADAVNLETVGAAVPTKDVGRSADLAVTGTAARKYGIGAGVGAIVGAAVLILAVLILDVEPVGTAVGIAAVAGAIGGALMGGYWGMTRRLPVNEDAYDTRLVNTVGPEGLRLEVRVEDDAKVDDVVSLLRSHAARDVHHVTA